MEYYAVMMNRTYLVLLTAESLIGIVVHGVIASNDRGDLLTRLITDKLSPDGDLANPMTYVAEKYRKRYNDVDLVNGDLSRVHKANFRVALSELTNVSYDASKKWGMGPYPHDGKVYIMAGKLKREFIILGDQSGNGIAESIKSKLPSALA